ncbi:hypothetical protein [Neoasaia chiangmaiensis]|uniref:hypothetical protein n=1 Tax=Neoasaia chiangmaiensis TaxID=320497 RepID=UPI0011EA58D1|nr:hypothetical protein [Neoasaia chiangmaiensis]
MLRAGCHRPHRPEKRNENNQYNDDADTDCDVSGIHVNNPAKAEVFQGAGGLEIGVLKRPAKNTRAIGLFSLGSWRCRLPQVSGLLPAVSDRHAFRFPERRNAQHRNAVAYVGILSTCACEPYVTWQVSLVPSLQLGWVRLQRKISMEIILW